MVHEIDDAAHFVTAVAGNTDRAGNTKYYAVSNRAALITALNQIAGQIASCVFTLQTPPPSPDDVAVDVGGTRTPRDPNHAAGWDYVMNGSAIEIFGAACDTVKAGNTDVQIIFGCPGVVIP